ncbi:MAG: LEA type 2 family protein [Geminicoccaceae bacterium]
MPRLTPALLCPLLLAACAVLTSDFEKPEISLAGLGFGKPGLREQELRLDLRVKNPNDFDIGVDSVDFDLEVNGMEFASGGSDEHFELPALGETVVPVTVDMPTDDFLDRVKELGTERRLDYKLSGSAKLDSMFLGAVPFEKEGKLALPKIPELKLPGF